MFSSSSALYQSAPPNTLVDAVTLALPGTLPVVNKQAVKDAIAIGLALNCSIREITKFDRKQYTYPDLMKGYQISQFDEPICFGGHVDLPVTPPLKIRINRVHMEEDVARLIHIDGPEGGTMHSLMDVNRAGAPLMEIVTEPDMRTSDQVSVYISLLQQIIRYLGVGTANMEEGSFRCDANISVRESGTTELTTKVEVKNMNRLKAVTRAIDFEIERQIKKIESGEKIIQETRGWVDGEGITVSQRSKEESHDYRYFPEPDIPPLKIHKSWISEIKTKLPELPLARKRRFEDDFDLSPYDAELLTVQKDTADFFEEVVSHMPIKSETSKNKFAKEAANWINGEISRYMNNNDVRSILKIPISSFKLTVLIEKFMNREINNNSAKKVFEIMWSSGKDPNDIVNDLNLNTVSDSETLSIVIEKIISNNPSAVTDFKSGKDSAIKYLMGQLMKETKGQADPKQSIEIIRSKLTA